MSLYSCFQRQRKVQMSSCGLDLDRQQQHNHKTKLYCEQKIILLTINHSVLLFINLFQYNLSLSCEILSTFDNVRSCRRVASTQIVTTITNTTSITLALLPEIVGIIINVVAS
jgi:hypothetical protein